MYYKAFQNNRVLTGVGTLITIKKEESLGR